MATEIQELLVKITPEGVEETTDQLADQSEQFEATADTAAEQTGKLEAFSEKWAGALQVFTAGLAVAAAGLLSQVPVLGEVFAGLEAIIQAVALAMDSTLRPVLTPLSNAMFDFAEQINQLDGPMRTVVGVIGTLVSVLAAVAGVALAASAAGVSFAGAWGVITTIASVIAGAVTTIIGVIGGIPIAIALAIAAVAAFTVAYITNWRGVRDKTNEILGQIVSAIMQGFGTILSLATQFGGNILQTIGGALSNVIQAVRLFIATVRTAFETLGAVVVSSLKSMANNAVAAIERAINAAIGAIPAEVRSRLGISRVNIGTPFDPRSVGDIQQAGQRRLSRRRDRIQNTDPAFVRQVKGLVQALQNNTQNIELSLDGQTVAENQRQFLGAGALNRGRGR